MQRFWTTRLPPLRETPRRKQHGFSQVPITRRGTLRLGEKAWALVLRKINQDERGLTARYIVVVRVVAAVEHDVHDLALATLGRALET